MGIELDKWKGKTLDGETLSELSAAIAAHAETLETRATKAEEKARKAEAESIGGRKTLKAERDRAFEKLGIDSADDLEALPDGKGQAEAVKQAEARIKRAERELAEKATAYEELSGKYTAERRDLALSKAVEKHAFNSHAQARQLLAAGVKLDGEDFRFDAGNGKLIALEDAAALLAKDSPWLLKPAGPSLPGAGSGHSKPGAKTITQAVFDSLKPSERAKVMAEGATLTEA